MLLQSISPSILCAAETRKEVQVVISQMTDFPPNIVSYFSCVETPGGTCGERPGKTSPNQVNFLSPKRSDLVRLEFCRATRQREVGGNPRTDHHREDSEGQVEPQPLEHASLTLPQASLTNGGQNIRDRGRWKTLCSCDTARLQYRLRSHVAGPIDG